VCQEEAKAFRAQYLRLSNSDRADMSIVDVLVQGYSKYTVDVLVQGYSKYTVDVLVQGYRGIVSIL